MSLAQPWQSLNVLHLMMLGGKASACPLLPGLSSPPVKPWSLLGACLPSWGAASFGELTDAIMN